MWPARASCSPSSSAELTRWTCRRVSTMHSLDSAQFAEPSHSHASIASGTHQRLILVRLRRPVPPVEKLREKQRHNHWSPNHYRSVAQQARHDWRHARRGGGGVGGWLRRTSSETLVHAPLRMAGPGRTLQARSRLAGVPGWHGAPPGVPLVALASHSLTQRETCVLAAARDFRLARCHRGDQQDRRGVREWMKGALRAHFPQKRT